MQKAYAKHIFKTAYAKKDMQNIYSKIIRKTVHTSYKYKIGGRL